MTTCKFCDKTIKKYSKWSDWKTRDSHFKCWKTNEYQLSIKFAIEQYIKDKSM